MDTEKSKAAKKKKKALKSSYGLSVLCFKLRQKLPRLIPDILKVSSLVNEL